MNPDIQKQILEMLFRGGSLYQQFWETVWKTGQADRERDGEDLFSPLVQDYIRTVRLLTEKRWRPPPLGIYGEALDQIMAAVDAHQHFTTHTAEFLIKFGRPFEASLKVLLQELEQERESEGDLKSTHAIYDRFRRLLDRAYDDYLKSPAGVRDVADLIQSYVTYREETDPVRDRWLKSLSIPTGKEMADVYKSIYDLKKRARKQDRRIAEQQAHIEGLTARVRALEDRAQGRSGKRPNTARKRPAGPRKSTPKKTLDPS